MLHLTFVLRVYTNSGMVFFSVEKVNGLNYIGAQGWVWQIGCP